MGIFHSCHASLSPGGAEPPFKSRPQEAAGFGCWFNVAGVQTSRLGTVCQEAAPLPPMEVRGGRAGQGAVSSAPRHPLPPLRLWQSGSLQGPPAPQSWAHPAASPLAGRGSRALLAGVLGGCFSPPFLHPRQCKHHQPSGEDVLGAACGRTGLAWGAVRTPSSMPRGLCARRRAGRCGQLGPLQLFCKLFKSIYGIKPRNLLPLPLRRVKIIPGSPRGKLPPGGAAGPGEVGIEPRHPDRGPPTSNHCTSLPRRAGHSTGGAALCIRQPSPPRIRSETWHPTRTRRPPFPSQEFGLLFWGGVSASGPGFCTVLHPRGWDWGTRWTRLGLPRVPGQGASSNTRHPLDPCSEPVGLAAREPAGRGEAGRRRPQAQTGGQGPGGTLRECGWPRGLQWGGRPWSLMTGGAAWPNG